jgi:hypothetical protein
VRIGQRIGLHRESTSHKFSIFEAEMRRRLWWQILILDSRSARLIGIAPERSYTFDVIKRPLNVNDSDLFPTMKEIPHDNPRITDMLFCSITYEIGVFMYRTRHWRVFDRKDAGGVATHISTKDQAINEFENHLKQRYLKYCDTSIPLHLLSSLLVESVLCQMRYIAHHPRQYPDKGTKLLQSEKDMLFSTCLKMIELDNHGYTMKNLQGYQWQVKAFFQFDALIYILSELRYRLMGELVDSAWHQVEVAYENHPEWISDTRNTLYVVIGSLAFKAWENKANFEQRVMPAFVSDLYDQRRIKKPLVASGVAANDVHSDPSDENREMVWTEQSISWEPDLFPDNFPPDVSPGDWDYWLTLLQGNESAPGGN